MKWQSPVTLAAVLLVAGCQGAPQHILPAAPQVVYQPLPQHRQSANVVIVPGNTAGIQQFAAAGVPLPVGGQYLLVQPGAPVLYMTRADGGDKPTEGGGGGGILTEWFNNILSWAPFGSSTTTPKPSEGEATTEGSTNKKPEEKPIKVVEASSGEESKPANLETLDEDVPAQTNPSSVPVLPSPGQRVVVIGQPQFFGSYDALRNPAIQQSLSTNGAVSSFLILKGQQAADGKVQVQEVDLQKYMASLKDTQNVQQHQQQPLVASPAAFQNLVYFNRQQAIDDDKASVTVEALGPRPVKTKQGEDNDDNEEGEEDGEDVVADPPGPSVAQVKPQAIALAGPGGVAAAAPIGTALVGPGGLAVAAPSATAVAGPSGGQPPLPGPGALSSPAALKAYILEQQNRGAPVVNPAASYQLAYNY